MNSRNFVLLAVVVGLVCLLAWACADNQTVCVGGQCAVSPADAGEDVSWDVDAGDGVDGPHEPGSDLTGEVVPDSTIDPTRDASSDPYSDWVADVGLDAVDLNVDGEGDVFVLDAQPHLTLPYTIEGEPVPSACFEVYEVGGAASAGWIELTLTGPFVVEGSLAPLAALETRLFTVTYTGNSVEPIIAHGVADLSIDGQTVKVLLSAVVGNAEIPTATWSTDRYGTRTVVDLPSAPFPHSSDVYTDSSVVVVMPPDLVDIPSVGAVMHLHGHNAEVVSRVASQYLVELHALSGRNAVFIAPQGPLEAASGNFGKLHESGGAANLVRDVLTLLYRDGWIERPLLGEFAVTSHSGGYKAAADITEIGGIPVRVLQLYDSVYARENTFAAFAAGGGVLRSNYTTYGGTVDNNQLLESLIESAGISVGNVFSDAELLTYDVIIGHSPADHSSCMWRERTAARWLTASNLLPRPAAPPDLMVTTYRDGSVTVRWRDDRGARGGSYRVEGSWDGSSWETLATVTSLQAAVSSRPLIRVVRITDGWGPSDPSDIYGTTGDQWLVVDGFDRVLGGSYLEPTHSFAADLGAALGEGYSVCSNEAVVEGLLSLDDYQGVLWMLGDESRADITFDADERVLVEDFVDAGGPLIVSGSEVGYATDATWFASVLHANYVADDANTTRAGGYTFGVTYDEDYPDVLSGQSTIWTYDTGGAAAVGWNRQVVVVGFPLETIGESQRPSAVGDLLDWLAGY